MKMMRLAVKAVMTTMTTAENFFVQNKFDGPQYFRTEKQGPKTIWLKCFLLSLFLAEKEWPKQNVGWNSLCRQSFQSNVAFQKFSGRRCSWADRKKYQDGIGG